MIFAKIDFINLLPFHVFIKKNIKSNQVKAIIEYKKSYPSVINKKFKKRKKRNEIIKINNSIIFDNIYILFRKRRIKCSFWNIFNN